MNIHKAISRLQSSFSGLMVIVIMLLPLLLTLNWLHEVVWGSDSRVVYSASQVATMGQVEALPSPKPFNSPIVSVTFDDGWQSIYTTAFPILQKYGIATTQYLIASEFENPSYMSEAQAKSMQQAGHEIGSHTMTHPDLTQLEPSKLEWEVDQSYTELSQRFGTVFDFASPKGAYNQTTLNAIGKHYRSQRNTVADPTAVGPEDVNLAATFEPSNIVAYTVRQSTTEADLANLYSYAKANNAWVVLVYHQVDDSYGYYSVSPETFERHMRHLRASGVDIAPLGRVLSAGGY